MSLPQSAEYHEAIQNARTAFIDEELKNAQNDGPVFMGVPGGPVARGNFAIVYRFQTGKRRLAVKCFTREKTDQQTRYQLIHEYLAAKKLTWTIDFNFVKEGIRVKGKSYPIVKMEWIENATTLLSHINEAVKSRQPLDSICDQFYQMSSDLRTHSVAHGDLQHANLIISNGKLVLIDYDGMCVPKTAGLKSEEDGLPDYQHPKRNGGTLHPTLDHFSILVIWTSLYALTIDASLWRRWVGEDERLLFRREDFIRPEQSSLIRELLSFQDPKMSKAVEAIKKALSIGRLEQIPHLVEIVTNSTSDDSAPWWQPEIAYSANIPNSGTSPGLPSWISQHKLTISPPVSFEGKTIVLSFYSAISMATALIVGILGLMHAMNSLIAFTSVLVTLAVYSIVLHIAFLRRPEVAAMREAQSKLDQAEILVLKAASNLRSKKDPYLKFIADHERDIANSEACIQKIETAINSAKKRAAELQRSLVRDQLDKRANIEKIEKDALKTLVKKKDDAKANYEAKLRDIDSELSSTETRFANQISILKSQTERDREAKFTAKFDSFVQGELAKISIAKNPVAGVSTYALNYAGFQNLADFTSCGVDGSLKHKSGRYIKVRGIGWVRANELVSWRKRMIERISYQIPAFERNAINNAVDAEATRERLRLESIRDQGRSKCTNNKLLAKIENEKILLEAEKEAEASKRRAKAALNALFSEEITRKKQISDDENAECEPLMRELWSLQSVVNPARHLIKSERIKMEKDSFDLSNNLAKANQDLDIAKQEFSRYASITRGNFMAHIYA